MTDPTPALDGLSHLGLSVVDLDAAVAFWSGPMGFEVVSRSPGMCLLLHRPTRVAFGVTDHLATVHGGFDELRAGLDHLALAVPDAAALAAWADRLDAAGVEHSPVAESGVGLHLNLRGPDRFPIELFVLSAAAAVELGLDAPAARLAHSGP